MKKRKISTYKGLPLVDATKDLEICVTKHDINKSSKNDPTNCAAANAAKRILHTDVEVHISRTYIKKNKKWIRFNTPHSVGREITSFDRGAAFEPGTYILKVVPKSNRLGYTRRGGTKTGEGT